MAKCDHLVLGLQASYVDNDGIMEPVVVLACTQCDHIAGYVDAKSIDNGPKISQVMYQYNIFPRLEKNSQLRMQLHKLIASAKEWEERAIKAEAQVKELEEHLSHAQKSK